jgi:5-methyltetrahydrofolate--homocysteine methyltransferase
LAEFLEELKRRVLIYDGGMGTLVQQNNLTAEDFWGKEGCNELLVLSRPDVIRSIHAQYFEAGSDIVETDSFGSSSIVLAEYDLADRVRELNIAAAKLAREVADQYSTPEKPRFVAGSMGPTTKLPSLGHIGYDEMYAAYHEQAEALVEGGVDVLLIETCQDLLQAKIAIAACQDAIRDAAEGKIPSNGHRIALQVQVTLEATGAMLLGSEISAALAVLESFQPDIIGMNCATGPAEMNDAVRFLCQNSTTAISVLPNAGLPQNEGGHAVYKLTPDELAQYHHRFVAEYGVRVVGGCRGAQGRCARRAPRAASVRRRQRLHCPAAGKRRPAGRHRRGDEHHHAARGLSQHGPCGRLRRHSCPGQASGQRRLADARPLLRRRRRGRGRLHERRA